MNIKYKIIVALGMVALLAAGCGSANNASTSDQSGQPASSPASSGASQPYTAPAAPTPGY